MKSNQTNSDIVREKLNTEAQIVKIPVLNEIVDQLKVMNNTLEEIHDELHEFTNRGSY